MDSIVHGISKSQKWLSNFHYHLPTHLSWYHNNLSFEYTIHSYPPNRHRKKGIFSIAGHRTSSLCIYQFSDFFFPFKFISLSLLIPFVCFPLSLIQIRLIQIYLIQIRLCLISRWEKFSGEGNGSPFQYPCWEISWTEKPGGLQSMGLQRVRLDWTTEHVISIPILHTNSDAQQGKIP